MFPFNLPLDLQILMLILAATTIAVGWGIVAGLEKI